jgi:hypothetical protein
MKMFKHNDDLVDYVQQHHALTVLFALHHIPSPSWRLVKEYALGELGASSLSDKCYRDRCKELVTLELARYVKRDPLKNDYYLTQHGHEAATEMERAFESVERWRTRALDKNESRVPDRSIEKLAGTEHTMG